MPGLATFAVTGDGQEVDAVSGSSLVIPDQPGGTFYVLLNTKRHPVTAAEWDDFFSEREVGVIMEDVECFVSRGDAPGRELADRYKARLAENQMRVKTEDGTLIASRAENGLFDVIILSKEAEAAYDYSKVFLRDEVLVIPVLSEEM